MINKISNLTVYKLKTLEPGTMPIDTRTISITKDESDSSANINSYVSFYLNDTIIKNQILREIIKQFRLTKINKKISKI